MSLVIVRAYFPVAPNEHEPILVLKGSGTIDALTLASRAVDMVCTRLDRGLSLHAGARSCIEPSPSGVDFTLEQRPAT